jgi:hypothetical protein
VALAVAGALAACGGERGQPARVATPAPAAAASAEAPSADAPSADAPRDDDGVPVPLGRRPRRIVSLGPVTTEVLFAIGAGDRLVGRSKWDGYPAPARRVADLGDALGPSLERVVEARPDLVLLYAAASNRDAAARLRAMASPWSRCASTAWTSSRAAPGCSAASSASPRPPSPSSTRCSAPSRACAPRPTRPSPRDGRARACSCRCSASRCS